MRMFGVLDLETQMEGCRFSIGIRNSHDKSLRLGLTVGIRVFVCSNMAFSGDFTPVLAKHSKSFNLIDTLAVGVDRIQRNFEPMERQVESWRKTQISDEQAKLVLYSAFVDGKLDAPRSLLPTVTISSRSTRNSRRARCGAYQTHSPARSRSSTQFLSSEQRRSWARSWPSCPHEILPLREEEPRRGRKLN